MSRRFMIGATLVAAVMVLSAPGAAQEHVHGPGATERLGTVHFATSCAPEVAGDFNRAVALLHSFEFGASIRAFNGVIARDSSCAMAWWGLALSNWSNPMAVGNRAPALLQRGREAAHTAARLGSGATERERQYIAAVSRLYDDYENRDQLTRLVAYERAMSNLVAQEPADTEARIFHALALAASAPPTDKSYANQLRAGAILESILSSQPDHPGIAHYIIHSYDVPALAGRASTAAQRYAEIAPSAAHALHMPSHTFTRVGMWQQSVNTNLRSMDVAGAAGSWSEVLHAADYAVYAYLQMRRDSAVRTILMELPTIAAKFDPDAVTGAAPGSAGVFALAAMPARYALERRAWSEAAELQPAATAFPYAEGMTYFARGLAAAHLRDAALARASIDSLNAIFARLTASSEPYWAEQVAIQRLGAQAWLDLADGRTADALNNMRAAADREDATEKSAVTPGPLAPARELLGDMLMQLKRPAEALVEYRQALTREPNRYRSVHGAMTAAAAFAQDTGAYSSDLCPSCAEWNAPQPPFRIFGNSYYVGTRGLGAILVTSDEGHVLIDGGLPESAGRIIAGIAALGFRIEDVKLIVNSHPHFDHAGGIATLQRVSGARVAASPRAAPVLERGESGPDDPQHGVALSFPPVEEVSVFEDGDTLRVGPLALIAHLTPGHTPGGTTWAWRSCDGDRCASLVYADSQTPVSADDFYFTRSTTYPSAIADFERGFAVLERLKCDILLTPHPGASQLWERVAAQDSGAAGALIDSEGCRRYAAAARQRLARRIAAEAP